jgi:hypothetical protein
MLLQRIDVDLPAAPDNVSDLRLVIARAESKSRQAMRTGCAELVTELRRECGDVRISKAHSESWIAVAAVKGARIGVDIELERPRPGFQRIADFVGLGPTSSHQFWHRWTLREAIAKSAGGSVLVKEDVEDDLATATVHGQAWTRARHAAALCGRLEDGLYYSLVLSDLQISGHIRCA